MEAFKMELRIMNRGGQSRGSWFWRSVDQLFCQSGFYFEFGSSSSKLSRHHRYDKTDRQVMSGGLRTPEIG